MRLAILRLLPACGALAQLVERYTGSVEVSGSTPLCSTNSPKFVLLVSHANSRERRGVRRCGNLTSHRGGHADQVVSSFLAEKQAFSRMPIFADLLDYSLLNLKQLLLRAPVGRKRLTGQLRDREMLWLLPVKNHCGNFR